MKWRPIASANDRTLARLDLVGVGDEGAKHPLALACRAGNLKRRQQVQEVGDKDMQDAGGTNRSIVGLPPADHL